MLLTRNVWQWFHISFILILNLTDHVNTIFLFHCKNLQKRNPLHLRDRCLWQLDFQRLRILGYESFYILVHTCWFTRNSLKINVKAFTNFSSQPVEAWNFHTLNSSFGLNYRSSKSNIWGKILAYALSYLMQRCLFYFCKPFIT